MMPHNETIKQEIIRRIQQIASENGGAAPGQTRFSSLTGIKDHMWRGKFWRGWGDALIEAGFARNAMQTAYSDTQLMEPIAELTKRLGHFPTTGDLAFEANNNSDFPSHKTILARWKMPELARAVVQHSNEAGDRNVAQLAEAYIASQPQKPPKGEKETTDGARRGWVYLEKQGDKYKVGKTGNQMRRHRQIGTITPIEVEQVHSILTDDPAGIEAYWLNRFKDRRIGGLQGEWFKLTKADVVAFRRWTKIW